MGPASVGGNTYVGVAQDRADFPFMNVLGLSTYPYLGGWTDPSQVPDDYFSRLASDPAIPVLISEGGWSSANIGAIHSSPALQAKWIARAATLAEKAHAVAWFQLDFTDIDLAAFGLDPNDPQVAPFAFIGLVDKTLAPKPALATWDSIFARSARVVAAQPRKTLRFACCAKHDAAGDDRPQHAEIAKLVWSDARTDPRITP